MTAELPEGENQTGDLAKEDMMLTMASTIHSADGGGEV